MGIFTRASPSARNPSFFKVMIGDFSKDLRIPPAFVKHFDGVVPHKSKIMRSPPDGKVWRVYLQKIDQCFFFRKGWGEFVEENFIESGDFLVFHYVGNSGFEVVIYGKHCCEKEILAATANNDETHLKGNTIQEKAKRENRQRERLKSKSFGKLKSSSSDEMETDSDGSSDGDESDTKEDRRQQGNKTKYKSSKLEEAVEEKNADDGTPFLGRLPYKVNKAGALKAASKFVTDNPYFKVVMQSTYLTRSLRIPKGFSSVHIKGSSRKAKLWASDRFWPVKLRVHRDWTGLGRGWNGFVKDNALGVGDVCVFEMFQCNEVVLKVSFFRCLP